jgi:ketosteroid isomerase-like protein
VSPSTGGRSDTPAASPGASAASTTDLSALRCATDDPEDVGDLTGAWAADDGGVYYIRQVGDCVWWFGTSLTDIEPGQTAQPGFANVAAGRIEANEIELQWADVPVGDILGGGGLTIAVAEDGDRLAVTRQDGSWGFGATSFTRVDADATSEASPSASASVSADAEAVFREFTAAVNAGDAAAAAALVAEDAEFYGDRATDLGVDGLIASLACAAEITSADVEGDTATVELEFTGRAPLTTSDDCPVGTRQSAQVTVRDGKIVELTDAD